ncbi:MAG: N-acetylmuramoyl-L-alanine amidase [Parvibaculales bacterium]
MVIHIVNRAHIIPILAVAMFLSCFASAIWAKGKITNIRIGENSQHTRIVLELSEKAQEKIYIRADPYRLIVEVINTKWALRGPVLPKGLIKEMEHNRLGATQQVIFTAKSPIKLLRKFTLAPQAGFPHRLVVDIGETSSADFVSSPISQKPRPSPLTQAKSKPIRRIIVIDPGHGGVDPGASSRHVKEKDIVFFFSQELYRQLKATGRYEPRLTRNQDVYIGLRQRVEMARKQKASLFISIHADAVKRNTANGLSVYTLSEKASDHEAASLARKENRSDIIAGINFEGQPQEVTDILIDLAQRETKNLSVSFTQLLLQSAEKVTPLLERPHRFAGFRVLKAPDVPSVLVELGFLTNRKDQKKLQNKGWHRTVSKQFIKAIDAYFQQLPTQ